MQGQYYHLYNRGAGKAKVFFNDGNYRFLLKLVKEYYQKHGATIIAYCLMPNHYHFLLRQETDIPLSKFVQVLFNALCAGIELAAGAYRHLVRGAFQA